MKNSSSVMLLILFMIISVVIKLIPIIIFISFLSLFIFTLWKIYEWIYYKSKKFNKLKNDLNEYVSECNELNDYIENLKYSYSNIKKSNVGEAFLIDESTYNFKRPEQLKAEKSEFICECSSSICKNAERQPFKYLCKYFNIKANEESLEQFENMLNKFSSVEDGQFLLNEKIENIKISIDNDIPYFIKTLSMKKFIKKLGFKEIDFNSLYFPVYTFRYVSPGGNKVTRCDIKLDLDNLNHFVDYLSDLVKFKKSIAGQRALMTSKLREKIKQRDNFTCQNCGLSINDEKNLLLEIDHIIPLSKGGITSEENLQTLCWKCNRKKGSKIINSFNESLDKK